MNKLFSLFILLFLFSFLNGQEINSSDSKYSFAKNTYLEYTFGASYLLDKDVYKEFDWGYTGSFRLRFDTKGNKMSFTPLISFRFYNEDLIDYNEITNNFQIVKLGLQFNYSLYKSQFNNFNFSTFFELDNTWIRNSLKWEDKSAFNNPYDKTKEYNYFDLFSGKNVSFVIGGKVIFYFVFIEAGFDILNSNVNLSNDYIKLLKTNSVSFESNPNYSMKSIYVMGGLSLSFSSIGKIFSSFKYEE